MPLISKQGVELNPSFQVHNGALYKIKEQMPSIIETILMCYKGYCGYSCRVNTVVCAGLPIITGKGVILPVARHLKWHVMM